jgi:hypothetical protein
MPQHKLKMTAAKGEELYFIGITPPPLRGEARDRRIMRIG